MDADTRRWLLELAKRISRIEERLDPTPHYPAPALSRPRGHNAYVPDGTNQDPLVEVGVPE